MKLNKQTSGTVRALLRLIILCMMFLCTNLFAQTNEWKTDKIDDGKITVRSCISERTNESNEVVPLIEYIATTTDRVSMQNCISLLKDASKHKEFHGNDVSKKIETITENEWIVYYHLNSQSKNTKWGPNLL